MHQIEQIKIVISYADVCAYWYTSEVIGKWFVDTLRTIFHVKFLRYTHWFMSIRISQMTDHSISVDQARYANYIVEKYLDASTVKASKRFIRPLN